MTLEDKKKFLRKNSIVITALFVLIIGSLISLSLQQSKQDEPSYIIINESGDNENFTGTYNQTMANLSIKDNGGFFLNFINGTNSPVRIIQHTISGLTGANITINDTTGGSGETGYNRIQNEGINVTQRTILNFNGENINCIDESSIKTTCNDIALIFDGLIDINQVTFINDSNSITGSPNFIYDPIFERLGIKTGLPNSTLQVQGSLALPIKTITSNYNATENDFTILCNSAISTITINLPTATQISGRIYIIKNINNLSTCIIDPNSSQLIDGISTIRLNGLDIQDSSIIIQSDGSNWRVLSKYFTSESLVSHWTKERLFTNIGTAFIDICNSTNCAGNPIMIDTNGKINIRLNVQWDKVGAGTHSVQLIRCTNNACTATDTVMVSLDVVSGNNNSPLTVIPSSLQNTINWYKLQAKSTTTTDDPSFRGAFVTLR